MIAGHDFVLLGERGQGKTRLLRALAGLLDEWTPVIAGAELGEHPYTPITPESIRRAAQLGDDLPVAWKHRSERYTEKLATPTPASPTWSATSTRSRLPRAAASGIPKPSPTGSSRGRTAASSRSTSCPTSPNASRCRCSTSWRSATSRSAATRCGCRWMCWWSPAPTPRTTPTVAASSRPSRTGSAPRSAPTTHWSWRRRWASSSRRRT